MRGRFGFRSVHMVCPRLLELDPRHGEHRSGPKYVHPRHGLEGHPVDCDCLVDGEGHRVATVDFPPGSELADDHPGLLCVCGERLVEGEWF